MNMVLIVTGASLPRDRRGVLPLWSQENITLKRRVLRRGGVWCLSRWLDLCADKRPADQLQSCWLGKGNRKRWWSKAEERTGHGADSPDTAWGGKDAGDSYMDQAWAGIISRALCVPTRSPKCPTKRLREGTERRELLVVWAALGGEKFTQSPTSRNCADSAKPSRKCIQVPKATFGSCHTVDAKNLPVLAQDAKKTTQRGFTWFSSQPWIYQGARFWRRWEEEALRGKSCSVPRDVPEATAHSALEEGDEI